MKHSWKDGTRTGSALFRMIRDRGHEGSLPQLQQLLAGWRRAERQLPHGDRIAPTLDPVRDPETGHAISPVIAAAFCMKPRGSLSPDQARKVEALKVGSPADTTMRRLAMRFNGILRARRADHLNAWMDDAIGTNLMPIMRFARTLHRDIDAVTNAIEMQWSNGQAKARSTA